MFCATCNLEYPDHLNFCRSCGQTLVRALGERATESVCCTRCGARVVHGEKFCQHCGTKVGAAAQETVIGRCQNCETYWKNSWLFCKNCGVDRDQALQWNTSANNQNPAMVEPEVTTQQSQCQYCTAAMQPFSLFCENCGMKLTKTDAVAEQANIAAEHELQASIISPSKSVVDSHDADDQLSRLDDLLLDDPLVSSDSAIKSNVNGVSASQPVAPKVKMPVELERVIPALRLVEKERETQNIVAPAPSLPETPAPPIVARSWREAVNIPSSADDEAVQFEKPSPTAGVSDRKLSLLLDDDVEPQRPFWHVPLLLGGLLLCVILVFGVWRRARVAIPSEMSEVTKDSKPVNSKPLNMPMTTPAGMVYIPGGKFEMGRMDGPPEERPVRTLEIKPFYLDRTEVTNQQYSVFIEATGHRAPEHWRGGKPLPVDVNLPVVNVTWQDASDFAAWANKRLPTEEEWEFAARGTDGRLYPWGKNWEPTFANTAEGKAGKIVEVGRYLGGASPYGVVDLCGNVWEWTSSQLRAYETQELLEDGVMVIRGGAYDSPAKFATMSYRGAVRIDKPYPKTGFRCARDFP